MGSKSSSSAASNVTDRRIGATDNAIVAAEGAQIMVTDSGAIARATQLAETALFAQTAVASRALAANQAVSTKSITEANQSTRKALESAEKISGQSFDFSGNTVDKTFSFARDVNLQALKNVETANKSLLDVSNGAISKIEQSTRSDGAVAFNSLMQTGAVVAIGFVMVQAMRN